MDANGVLQPQGTATDKIVNGVDDFTQFAASNPTSTVTRREEARFYWQVTQIGKSTTESNAAGSKGAVLTNPVLMGAVLFVGQCGGLARSIDDLQTMEKHFLKWTMGERNEECLSDRHALHIGLLARGRSKCNGQSGAACDPQS